MAVIEKLRYVRLGVENPETVTDFVSRIVGLQPVEAPEGLALFRSDSRDHTLSIHRSADYQQALAVEVRDPETLDELAAKLEKAGYDLHVGTEEELQERRCKQMIRIGIRNGLSIEIVVRPQDSGWRYFATRDAGITEFFGLALASTDVEHDIKLWTDIFGGKVSDWVGDTAYIALDDEHHRIAIHPSDEDRILEMQFKVEGLDQIMQNKYFLETAQVSVVQGPGRRPTSQQLFLSYSGPAPMLFGLVAEGEQHPFDQERLPRQFPASPQSFCSWGSTSTVHEFSPQSDSRI